VLLRISDVTEQKLLQQQIVQSEKMATLGVLATSIAHEINIQRLHQLQPSHPVGSTWRRCCPSWTPTPRRTPISRSPHALPGFPPDVFNLLENMGHGAERIRTFVAGLKTSRS